jgi:hypothetical protein
MPTTNIIIALDMLSAVMNTAMRLSQLIQAAQIEGRDLNEEELKALRDESDRVVGQLNSLG